MVQDRWDNEFNEDTYNFCSTFTPNALELNQIYEEAAPIALDTCFEANIYGDNHLYTEPQDVDWFEVQTDNPGILEIAVTSVPDNIDLNVEVYQVIDNVLTLVADDGVGSPAYGENMFISTIVDAGTYLIVVNDRWDNEFNEDTYNFCLSFADIDEQSLSNQVQVFPNPGNGQFNINILSENNDLKLNEIKVFDLSGREEVSIRKDILMGNEIFVDMTSLTKGLYIIRIVTNKGIITKKILVQ